jgi:hypothetical protein
VTPLTSDLLSRVRAEIEARLDELRPSVHEYERLLAGGVALAGEARAAGRRSPRRRGSAAPRSRRAPVRPPGASATGAASAKPERERAPRGAAQQAIVAALEHGSHTVGELTVVTAISGANVRANLRRLVRAGTVTPARRDGKAAYALARSAEG